MKFYLGWILAIGVSSSLATAQNQQQAQIEPSTFVAISSIASENKAPLSETGSSSLESSMYDRQKSKWGFRLTQETFLSANTVNYGDYKGTTGLGYAAVGYKFDHGGSLQVRQYIASRYSEDEMFGQQLEAGAKPTDLAFVYFKANAATVFGQKMHFMARHYMPLGDIDYEDKNWQSRAYLIFPFLDTGKWKLSYALVSRYYIYESSLKDDRTRFTNELTTEYVVNDDFFLYTRLYQDFYYKKGLDEAPELLGQLDTGFEYDIGVFTINPYVKQTYDFNSGDRFKLWQVDKDAIFSNISYNIYLKMKI